MFPNMERYSFKFSALASANGTFALASSMSPGGMESGPWSLKNDEVPLTSPGVEFPPGDSEIQKERVHA